MDSQHRLLPPLVIDDELLAEALGVLETAVTTEQQDRTQAASA